MSGKNGISINAADVTVDLNGFALIHASGLGEGIIVPAAHRNLHIHNGSVQGWGGAGINCSNATNSQFDHLRVSQNATGLICGDGNVLREISADVNANGGISTGAHCTLAACYAANTTAGDGIFTGDHCTVTASTSVGNTNGFNIQNRCTIIGCTALSNTGVGIYPGGYSVVKDCTATLNGTGILASGTGSQIISNHASLNNGAGLVSGFKPPLASTTGSIATIASAIRVTGSSILQ